MNYIPKNPCLNTLKVKDAKKDMAEFTDITFTTAVACAAITELIHRLTGFMGVDRESTEVIHFFDQTVVRTNAVAPDPDCSCQNKDKIGIADTRDFLGMVWR